MSEFFKTMESFGDFDLSSDTLDSYLNKLNDMSNSANNNSSNNSNQNPTTISSPQLSYTPQNLSHYTSTKIPTTIHEGMVRVPPSTSSPSTSSSYKCNLSRTQLKLELMRNKAVEEERRESESRKRLLLPHPTQQQVQQPPPLASLSSADLPLLTVTPQIFKLSLLENPTQYHFNETLEREARSLLSSTITTTTGSVPHEHSAPFLPSLNSKGSYGGGSLYSTHLISSAPPTLYLTPRLNPLDGINGGDVGVSPGNYSSIVSSLGSASAPDDEDELINGILDLEDATSQVESEFRSLNCTDSLVVRSSPSKSIPGGNSRRRSGGQRSLPLTLSTNDPQRIAKDRERKDNHNKIERKRRFNINDRIKEIEHLFPKEQSKYYKELSEFRHHKGKILQGAVKYIKMMREDNEKNEKSIEDKKNKIKELELENRQLSLKIKSYEKSLASNGIPIPDTSRLWRPGNPEELQLITHPIIKSEPGLILSHHELDLMDDDGVLLRDPMLAQGFLNDSSQVHHLSSDSQRMDFM